MTQWKWPRHTHTHTRAQTKKNKFNEKQPTTKIIHQLLIASLHFTHDYKKGPKKSIFFFCDESNKRSSFSIYKSNLLFLFQHDLNCNRWTWREYAHTHTHTVINELPKWFDTSWEHILFRLIDNQFSTDWFFFLFNWTPSSPF